MFHSGHSGASVRNQLKNTFKYEHCVRLSALICSIDVDGSSGPEVCDEALLRCVALWVATPEETKNTRTFLTSSSHLHSWQMDSACNLSTISDYTRHLSLKKSISPRRVVTASKTMVESQASGVVGGLGPG